MCAVKNWSKKIKPCKGREGEKTRKNGKNENQEKGRRKEEKHN
jgi:hypothetical protein